MSDSQQFPEKQCLIKNEWEPLNFSLQNWLFSISWFLSFLFNFSDMPLIQSGFSHVLVDYSEPIEIAIAVTSIYLSTSISKRKWYFRTSVFYKSNIQISCYKFNTTKKLRYLPHLWWDVNRPALKGVTGKVR